MNTAVSPFNIYNSWRKAPYNSIECCDDCPDGLPVPSGTLMNHAHRMPEDACVLLTAEFINMQTRVATGVTFSVSSAYDIFVENGVRYYQFNNGTIPQMPEGTYALEYTCSDGNKYYSDAFCVTDCINNHKLEWKHNCNTQDMVFENDFYYSMWLPGYCDIEYDPVGVPEVVEDGKDVEVVDFVMQDWIQIEFGAVYGYMKRVLTALNGHSNITFIKSDGEFSSISLANLTSFNRINNKNCTFTAVLRMRQKDGFCMPSCCEKEQGIEYPLDAEGQCLPVAQPVECCDPATACVAPAITGCLAGESTILLTWNSVSGAVGYEIARDCSTIIGTVTPDTDGFLESEFTITGLDPCIEYTFCVRTICVDGTRSNWSSITCFTSNQPCVFDCASLTIEQLTISAIDLSWNNGGNISFEWQLIEAGGDFSSPLQSDITTSSPELITGLDAGTNYVFRIRSLCPSNPCTQESEWCVLSFSTDPCDIDLEITTEIGDCEKDPSISVGFTNATGGYIIYLEELDGTLITNTVSNPLVDYPLPVGTYVVRVLDLTNGCETENILITLSTTCDNTGCSAPLATISQNSQIECDSAVISWSTVSGADSYCYQIWEASQPTPTTEINETGTVASLTGLTPCTTYKFRVKSKCEGIESNWSNEVEFTTDCSCEECCDLELDVSTSECNGNASSIEVFVLPDDICITGTSTTLEVLVAGSIVYNDPNFTGGAVSWNITSSTGQNYSVTITDNGNSSCTRTFTGVLPDCSTTGDCSIVIDSVDVPICQTDGTAQVPINITVSNAETSVISINVNGQVTTQSVPTGSGPFSLTVNAVAIGDGTTNAPISITFSGGSGTCTAMSVVDLPLCQPACSLDLQLSQSACDANGEVVVTLDATASTGSSSVNLFAWNGTTFVAVPAYSPFDPSITQSIPNVPGNGTTLLLEIRDVADPSCTAQASIVLNDCSECTLGLTLDSVECDEDNGIIAVNLNISYSNCSSVKIERTILGTTTTIATGYTAITFVDSGSASAATSATYTVTCDDGVGNCSDSLVVALPTVEEFCVDFDYSFQVVNGELCVTATPTDGLTGGTVRIITLDLAVTLNGSGGGTSFNIVSDNSYTTDSLVTECVEPRMTVIYDPVGGSSIINDNCCVTELNIIRLSDCTTHNVVNTPVCWNPALDPSGSTFASNLEASINANLGALGIASTAAVVAGVFGGVLSFYMTSNININSGFTFTRDFELTCNSGVTTETYNAFSILSRYNIVRSYNSPCGFISVTKSFTAGEDIDVCPIMLNEAFPTTNDSNQCRTCCITPGSRLARIISS